MPAKTPKQRRFMAGCATDPKKMGKKCPPPSVARDFMSLPRNTLKKARSRGR